MSRPSVLPLHEKQLIAEKYQSGEFTQDELATQHAVSRRTVQRALAEMGVTRYNEKKPRLVTEEEEAILVAVKRRGLKATTLEQILNAPALTKDNVQQFLTRLEPVEMANLLYVVGYLKVQNLAKRQAANQQAMRNTEAANG